MHPEPEDLRQLPIAEKLRRVQQLWDEIAASGERFPLPEWHREEAQRRARELEAEPSIAIAREDLWRAVADANG
jgi:putative addiction module component (TIGR02574 family)